ncbi:hypothetical protein DPMN_070498 [Dreissena polymorpha]|uniref:Uncharacterized protein n=1 Tax=Dreissena polymorpha TaxID=45954 RepID=A0A9D3Z6A4_DREPO|nr:hypothetical protein DPMN_070498 [Dreissena polymorpha]
MLNKGKSTWRSLITEVESKLMDWQDKKSTRTLLSEAACAIKTFEPLVTKRFPDDQKRDIDSISRSSKYISSESRETEELNYTTRDRTRKKHTLEEKDKTKPESSSASSFQILNAIDQNKYRERFVPSRPNLVVDNDGTLQKSVAVAKMEATQIPVCVPDRSESVYCENTPKSNVALDRIHNAHFMVSKLPYEFENVK